VPRAGKCPGGKCEAVREGPGPHWRGWDFLWLEVGPPVDRFVSKKGRQIGA
jgi:hypothetical protein